MIEELYTPQQIELRNRARELAEKVMRPVAAKYDVEQTYPWEVQQAIREAGLSGVWIPRSTAAWAAACSTCASSSRSSRGPAAGWVSATRSTRSARSRSFVGGTDEQKEGLPRIAAGDALIAFGLPRRTPAPTRAR